MDDDFNFPMGYVLIMAGYGFICGCLGYVIGVST